MSRRSMREHVFKLLFLSEFHKQDEIQEQINDYVSEYITKQESVQYIVDKVKDIIVKTSEIDEVIETKSDNWKINRIGKAELAILRLAIYEINSEEDIPKNVSISEAVELTIKYCGEGAKNFVNGVLSKM